SMEAQNPKLQCQNKFKIGNSKPNIEAESECSPGIERLKKIRRKAAKAQRKTQRVRSLHLSHAESHESKTESPRSLRPPRLNSFPSKHKVDPQSPPHRGLRSDPAAGARGWDL